MSKKAILLKLGLNSSQFYYSLKSIYDKEELNDIKWRLKQNSTEIVSLSVKENVAKPEVKIDDVKVVIKEIVEEKLETEKTTVDINEEINQDYQEFGGDLKKGEYVVLDTSIIGIDFIVEILKNKGVNCIFPTIVIEELDKHQKNPNLCGYNAKGLLRLAIEEESIVVPIPKKTSLVGWREENSDSFIVQIAFDLKEKYNPIVITSDKVLALKAKSQGLRFQYWDISSKKQEKIKDKNNSTEFVKEVLNDDFLKICDRNTEITVNIFNMKNKKYMYPRKGLHRYFVFDKSGNEISNYQGLIPYKPGYTLFIRHEHCIQKIEFKNHDKKNNANLICEAFFVGGKPGEFENLNTLSVIESNRQLKIKKEINN